MFNVKDQSFEVIVNGSRDERASIQNAIDACGNAGGGDVFFPVGTYSLKDARNPAGNRTLGFCIRLASKVRLVGENRTGSIIKQADNLDPSARLIQIESNDCGLSNLTLDGNKAKQSIDEHRHGIFVRNAKHLKVENVTSQNFTGDGFYIGSEVNQVMFSNVLATLNDRAGIALAQMGKISDITIVNSQMIGNAKQQIDSEPKIPRDPQGNPIGDTNAQVNNVAISGCLIDPGSSKDYAVTCTGGGPKDKDRSHGWTLTGNIIKGAVAVVWCDDVCITGNVIDNPTTKPCVDIQRTAKNIVVTGNRLKLSQTTTPGVSAVSISGKKEGSLFDVPSLVSIMNNTISVSDPRCLAAIAQGADSVSIMGNQIDGGGIQVRATAFGSAVFRSAIIIGNTIANVRLSDINRIGSAIECVGDKQAPAAGRFGIVDISHNVIINSLLETAATALKQGIFFANDSLFDDTIIIDGKKLNEDIQITMIGNHIHGSKAPLTNFPKVPYLTGGNRGAGAVFGRTQ
jgi:polygalacturonase